MMQTLVEKPRYREEPVNTAKAVILIRSMTGQSVTERELMELATAGRLYVEAGWTSRDIMAAIELLERAELDRR
jgi:hypothetical protein